MKQILTIILLGAVCGFAPAASALTKTEADHILYLKQEEKLARDVYQALFAVWGHTTFQNIAVSEQRHMDAVDGLIVRYKLADTTPSEIGKFTIKEVQDLYDDLVAEGGQSLEAALRVGVTIEEMDIKDLEAMLLDVQERAIVRVMKNLLQGSSKHLAAFNNALAQLAASPTTSPSATCDRVCGSCPANCAPIGQGPGQGQGQKKRGGR